MLLGNSEFCFKMGPSADRTIPHPAFRVEGGEKVLHPLRFMALHITLIQMVQPIQAIPDTKQA